MMKPEHIVVAAGIAAVGLALIYNLFDSPDYGGLAVSINPSLPPNSLAEAPPGAPAQNWIGAANAAPGWIQPRTMAAAQSLYLTAPDLGGSFVSPDIRLHEGHWQGMEALLLTAELKRKLRLPMNLEGLLIDEVTLNAAASGLLASDVLIAINGRQVVTLDGLARESRRVKNRNNASLTVIRNGRVKKFTLRGGGALGFAQMETAPMILPGAIMPHPYRGECTMCHPIGSTGHIVPDPGGVILPPPSIRKNAARPHRDRGPCAACHIILN